MSRPVEQALNTIIPRRSGVLPAELIELANSLLAQSRNKCSNLKAEEEVARTYACANLACERLKTSLNLPPIEPSPPIPPRAYNKLYAYFDRSLTTSTARRKAAAAVAASSAKSTPVTTPSKSKATPSKATPSKSAARTLPQRQTPSKETSFSSFRTPKSGLKYTSSKEKGERVPKWVHPSIRQLCKDLDTPRAAPHIMAGVETILTSPPPSTTPSVPLKGKTPALIAAIWFFVVVRMRGQSGQGRESLQRKKQARESLVHARENPAVLAKTGDGEENWTGWEVVNEKDVNAWRQEIVSRGWREMDWFTNIVEGSGVELENDVVEESEEEMEMEKRDGEETGRRRQGKVVLEKYDYLSEAKQREYQEWRTALLAKVHEMMEEAGSEKDTLDEEGDVDMS